MKMFMLVGAAVLIATVQANTPPIIENVRAEQRKDTKLVDIYYDAADADNDALKVRIEISDNDGAKYSVPAFSLTGDIGEGITPGTGKHIVWDAGTDWDGECSDQMRVKVFAIDAQGFPGMEWGNEVPPGGFLMGQDGGAEGSGPSRHVNIPWSYWLSKYEVTASQYCDFLNTIYVAGYIGKYTLVTNSIAGLDLKDVPLCSVGDYSSIRWNVNKFEIVESNSNMPVIVTWVGAIAFARYYGYDLPTTAEWEKAARGPDNDDQGEHLLYPWGNIWSDAYANGSSFLKEVGTYNGNQIPVGPDAANGYGLYDVIGNAGEWTRSRDSVYDLYPAEESLSNSLHALDRKMKVVRGFLADFRPAYIREKSNKDITSETGFRVVRRASVEGK